MCRIAIFPAGFDKNKAYHVLFNFVNGNEDGIGLSYLQDGEFVVKKWAKSLVKITEKIDILEHLPDCKGWTIVHLRNATHGDNRKRNTHPFIIDNKWSFIHNGVWSDHKIAKICLNKFCKFEGETDSEIAGNLFNILGPKEFSKKIDDSGVFVGLDKNGELWITKSHFGDLVYSKGILASELDKKKYREQKELKGGWYNFSARGKLKDYHILKEKTYGFKSGGRVIPYNFNVAQFRGGFANFIE